jgi:hypothetical protein
MTWTPTPFLWALSEALTMGTGEKVGENQDEKNIVPNNHHK